MAHGRPRYARTLSYTDAVAPVVAITTAVQAIVVVAAARYAKRQVEAARTQVDEARLLREAQARPFVVIAYEERMILDLGVYRKQLSVSRDTVHHVSETLKKIQREIHKWTASGQGLLVVTPEELKARWGVLRSDEGEDDLRTQARAISENCCSAALIRRRSPARHADRYSACHNAA